MSLTLNPQDIARCRARAPGATGARPMPRLTDDFPAMTLTDGYAVQDELRHRWLAAGRRRWAGRPA
jgi:2-oxo-3-hexenedioate decarboxylase